MIEAQNLVKRYGSTMAVNDLSFSIRPGLVTGFLGPNGAGKTITMRMIPPFYKEEEVCKQGHHR
jgi:ABC-2 type transport system ATP-binding protein